MWVEGEVSNLSTPASGHVYFTLKDAGAQLRCVLFRSTARNLRFRLRDGVGLILMGRVTVYEQRGEYQLVVDLAEPCGIGALQLAFQQLKEKLAAEGLFDEVRKRPLPALPRCIGIVTSRSGAALHDILHVLNRRFGGMPVVLCPVRVQGEGAAAEIAAGIDALNACAGIDVMIVGRGGGSLEDLWAFNEEQVARAIARSKIPVISAVGHEVDFTIADFVADLRAPTPSAAAEIVVRSRVEMTAEVETLAHRLSRGMGMLLDRRRAELHRLLCLLKHPPLMIEHRAQRVDDLAQRLQTAVAVHMDRKRGSVGHSLLQLRALNPAILATRSRDRLAALNLRLERAGLQELERRRERLTSASAMLQALSPLGTLARGYSITTVLPQGSVVEDAAQLDMGSRIAVRFRHGSAEAVVEKLTPDGPASGGP